MKKIKTNIKTILLAASMLFSFISCGDVTDITVDNNNNSMRILELQTTINNLQSGMSDLINNNSSKSKINDQELQATIKKLQKEISNLMNNSNNKDKINNQELQAKIKKLQREISTLMNSNSSKDEKILGLQAIITMLRSQLDNFIFIVKNYITKFGGYGTNNGKFKEPLGIAVDNDYIYVVDNYRYDVQIFNKNDNYKFVAKFGKKETKNKSPFENGSFRSPQSIAVDNNFIYVVDQLRYDVQIFNKSDNYKFVTKFGERGKPYYNPGNGNFSNPISIAVDNELIYVIDYSRNDVQVFNKSNIMNIEYVTKFGERDDDFNDNILENGSFQSIKDITIENDYIYIVDNYREDVQIFNKSDNYKFVTKFGGSGTDNGKFKNPLGIAVYNELIYVIDHTRKDVQFFNKSNIMNIEYITKFGEIGVDDGEFRSIRDIASFYNDDYIYIVDNTREDVQVFNKSVVVFP